jgi:hypothetical protein
LSALRHQYQTAADRSPYAEWFNRLDAAAAAKIDNGRREYLFELDPIFEDRLPAFYVSEGDVEPCARPSDDEVKAINALQKYGS